MLPNYVPILILAVIVFGFAITTVIMSRAIGKPRPNDVKSATYECGVPPIGNARERFPIKFYLVCMIFILFDVDAAFLYPWALIFRDLGVFGFVEMGVFILLIGGGFVYAWKVGALDW
jgi:NADH-quinone oxidoreductase subunit A